MKKAAKKAGQAKMPNKSKAKSKSMGKTASKSPHKAAKVVKPKNIETLKSKTSPKKSINVSAGRNMISSKPSPSSPQQAAPTQISNTKPLKGGVKGSEKIKLSKEEKKSQVLAHIAAAQKEEKAEVVLTNADGKQYCKVHDCDQGQTTEGYCRLHYIALWKRNRSKVKILEGGKLDKYIEDLTSKYPDKYLEMLRKDLSSEKDFTAIVAEMDVEDSGDDNESEEEASRFIEEVRGGVPATDDDDGGF